MKSIFLMLLFSLVACSRLESTVLPADATQECSAYSGTEDVLAFAPTHLIMLGEMHGTEQSVEAFSGLLCAALSLDLPVKVGLEAEAWQGERLNAQLDRPFDAAGLIEVAPNMWTTEDGRSSLAVMQLLRQISEWRALGHDIEVFAFDYSYEEWDGEGRLDLARSEIMAERIDEALAGFHGVALILTGEFHARKSSFDFGGQTYVPVASRVASRPVLSLKMQYGAGDAWVQAGIEKPNGTYEDLVGPLALTAIAPAGSPERAFVLEPDKEGLFDGSYFTGPVTASPPAIRSQ